tara:strand:- start:16 stop:291 length:276 start_codon:yes stop_codon:yes gene_type:complete
MRRKTKRTLRRENRVSNFHRDNEGWEAPDIKDESFDLSSMSDLMRFADHIHQLEETPITFYDEEIITTESDFFNFEDIDIMFPVMYEEPLF